MSIEMIKIKILNTFNIFFLIVFSYITIDIIWRPSKLFINIKPIVPIIGMIIFLQLIRYLDKKFLNLNNKNLILISISSFIIIGVIQVIFLLHFKVNPSWDFGVVFNTAVSSINNFNELDSYYYINYPNNIPIFFITLYCLRFFSFLGISDYLSSLIVINIVFIIIALVILYILILKRYGLSRATLYSIIFIFVTPIYSYTPIFYSDTLSMLFPILLLLIYNKLQGSKGSKQVSLCVLLGLVLSVGVLIKLNVIILVIALIIHYFFMNKFKNFIVFLISIILSLIIVNFSYNIIISQYIPSEIKSEDVGFPTTHWIMMSLFTDGERQDGIKGYVGAYNSEDVEFTNSLKNQGLSNKEIQQEHLKVINERLNKLGVRGYLDYLQKKINYTWSDGTYYGPDKLSRNPLEYDKLQSYVIGENNSIFIYLSQTIHVSIFILMLLGSIRIYKSKKSFENSITIFIFGVFLFLIIWETRSRYLVLFIPVFLLLSSYGLNEYNLILDKLKSKIKNSIFYQRKNI